MRFTHRDSVVIRDLGLSHVLSRDQLIALGYFGSITRANTRLRELIQAGLVRRLETPFFGQGLYVVTKRAAEVAGDRIAPLIEGRASSPRFIQHALAVTNVRLALSNKSSSAWRFEQQLWRKLKCKDQLEIRPDGLFMTAKPLFIEVDLGHVAPRRFATKLEGYTTLAKSGDCSDLYGFAAFRLLVVTTGTLRSRHLSRLAPKNAGFDFMVQTFAELGAPVPSTWS